MGNESDAIAAIAPRSALARWKTAVRNDDGQSVKCDPHYALRRPTLRPPPGQHNPEQCLLSSIKDS